MSQPTWHKNLQDAVLLDPLIMIHGNVKDLFHADRDKRGRLPSWMRDQGYINFDVWLALEFEQSGFDIVLLYDPVDGAVALRREMIAPFEKLAAQSPGADERGRTQQQTRSQPAESRGNPTHGSAPALPTAGAAVAERVSVGNDGADGHGAAAEAHNWMVPLSTRMNPTQFFQTLYQNVFPRHDQTVAVICRFSDRYLSYTDRQDKDERELSLLIQKTAMAVPATTAERPAQSRIAMVFDLEGGIPQELHVFAPFTHSVLIPPPSIEEREQFYRENGQEFYSEVGSRFDPDENLEHLRLLANLSDGLKMQDLLSLIALSRREKVGLGPGQAKTLLDRFRFGTRDNAWTKVTDESLRNAKDLLQQRVKGQDEVIDDVVPILIRAKMGMSDPSGTAHSTKPRGVFFFVGPTGVGKTELSKAIAELIFGDESAMLRFDMSEYSEEHQQARLIGAPPGYVGFDQGGQLTSAIHEKPFSVVLFDEIEKAHGRILDKFLQVLDEGRLTDGMGRTVYFSEAILIFTSNLGTAPRSRRGGGDGAAALMHGGFENTDDKYKRLSELGYEALCEHFRAEVKQFFINELGRPEILNRIGEDNILVFKFLRNEAVKDSIVSQQIERLDKYLREKQNVGLICTPRFRRLLICHPSGFERNGARGVRNLLSKWVFNPLSEQLFLDRDKHQGKIFVADYRVKSELIDSEAFDRSKLEYHWESA